MSPGSAVISGQYTMLQTGGDYAWSSERVQLGITGATAFRYYSQAGDFQNVSHSGGIGLSAALARRTQLALNGSGAYSPSYSGEPVSECRCATAGRRTANQPELCGQRCCVLRVWRPALR